MSNVGSCDNTTVITPCKPRKQAPSKQPSAAALNVPKTGKRGVPQQFPRRLYEMIEAESIAGKSIISWSETGLAFHIQDTNIFSTHVLPKYFRTNKFSSFQRNLNLYGFTKVRRGPDTDMYAHPSFIRGRKDAVAQLRKGGGTSNGHIPTIAYNLKKQTPQSHVSAPAVVSVTSSSRSSSFSSQEGLPPCMKFLQKQKDDASTKPSSARNICRNRPEVSQSLLKPFTCLVSSNEPIHRLVNEEVIQDQAPRINNCSKLELLTLALTSLADA